MTESTPAAPSASPDGRLPRWRRVGIAALVSAHFLMLLAFFAPAICTPDANGYFAQATRIARQGRTGYLPGSPLEYVGMHWLKADSGWYYSRYSPGLPAILAAAMKIAGRTGALLVNPLMASLTVLGLYLLARRWAAAPWAFVAAAAMALNPIANAHALAADSHTSVAFFLVWGLWALECWRDGGRAGWAGWAALAGWCLGMVPAIRYPEILLSGAAGLYMLWHAVAHRRGWRGPVAFCAAAGAPLVALAVHNQAAFGAFWKTGYSLTNEQTGFGIQYFLSHALQYLEGLPGSGLGGAAFGIGVAGIAAMCARRETRARGLLLVGLIVPTTLLYMAYYWAPQGRAQATMRFLLPTFPVYLLAGAWLLGALARSGLRRAARAIALVAVLLTLAWGLPMSIGALARLEMQSRALDRITRLLERQVPPGSVVVANSWVLQHLDFVGRWKLVEENTLLGRIPPANRPLGRSRSGDSDRPSPMQHGKLAERSERYGGKWGTELARQVAADIEAWAGAGARVFWIGRGDTITTFETQLPWSEGMKTLATIDFEAAQRTMQRLDKHRGDRPGGMDPGGPGAMAPGVPVGDLGEAGEGPGAMRPGAMGALPGGARRLDRMRQHPGAGGGPMNMWRTLLTSGEPLVLMEWVGREQGDATAGSNAPRRRSPRR